MRPFRSTMIEVQSDGEPVVRTPAPFGGKVSEALLEKWLIQHPDLAGEALLVLGSQLAEFAEDKDRLDVLALDQTGELVLIELKVDDSFRVTDLQALAYAGAYATLGTAHLARVLRNHVKRHEDSEISVEESQERITAFLGYSEYGEWSPSQRVRIKLLAPGFPQRVLKTVKWLGDVYGMPIEAIEVKLFEDSGGAFHLTVERLLPVQGDDAFGMTVRAETEVRQQTQNISRRPAVLQALIANGDLVDGQALYLHFGVLWPEIRDAYDPADPVFKVTLDASTPTPRFRWQNGDRPAETLPPSAAWHSIIESLLPGRYEKRYWPVHTAYSTSPGGETLGEMAERTGAWQSDPG